MAQFFLTVNLKGGDARPLTVAGKQSVWAAAAARNIPPEEIATPLVVSLPPDDGILGTLVERLRKAGYTVWARFPGESGSATRNDAIDAALDLCAAVVAPFNEDALKPDYESAHYILDEAARRFLPVIPVMLEKVSLPVTLEDAPSADLSKNVEKGLSRLQSILESAVRRSGRWLDDQTPGQVRQFVGRERELEEVVDLLKYGEMLAISARGADGKLTGGIGKTTLAEEVARRTGARYPGGVLFEERGPDPPATEDVFFRWASIALGHDPAPDFPLEPKSMRKVLDGVGELLVIIDDVWEEDYEAVKFLLTALPPDADRILTTRFALDAKDVGARVFRLGWLTERDGIALLRQRLMTSRAVRKDEVIDEEVLKRLHAACEGHALALEMAAARCKRITDLPKQVEALEKRLKTTKKKGVAAIVEASLQESLEVLHDANEKAALWFPLLGIFAQGATFDTVAAASMWGADSLADAGEALRELVGHAMLSVDDKTRLYYQQVPLHDFARELLTEDPEVLEAASRHAEHYQKLVEDFSGEHWGELQAHSTNINLAGDRICNSMGDDLIESLSQPEPPDPLPKVDADVMHTVHAALDWALATRHYAASRGTPGALRWLRAGLAAARLLNESAREAELLLELALWHRERNDEETALAYVERATVAFRESGDLSGQAHTLVTVGNHHRDAGRLQFAFEHFEQAEALYKDAGDIPGQANAIAAIALAFHQSGEPSEALKRYKQALKMLENENAAPNRPTLLNDAGLISLALEKPRDALGYFEKALPYFEDGDNAAGEATTLNNIGAAYMALGKPEDALKFFERAVPVLEASGDVEGLATTYSNIGLVYHAMNLPEGALEHFEYALPLYRQVNAVPSQVALLDNMAVLLRETPELGRESEAVPLLEEAITLMQQARLGYDAGGTALNELRRRLAEWRGY